MRIKELRKSKNLTQAELADITNSVYQNISRYERGEREPDLSTLIRIADYFDVSLDYLVGRDFTPPSGVPEQYVALSDVERSLLDSWRSLDETQKEIVFERVNTLLDLKKRKNEA